MSIICPAILADTPQEYARQLDNVKQAKRLHIDFMDGSMSDSYSVSLNQAYWNKSDIADLHVMFNDPISCVQDIIKMNPNLVIIHAECDADVDSFIDEFRLHDINIGLAILPDTSVETIAKFLSEIQHVLIFSGHLGHFGGKVDLGLLEKVKQIKNINPAIEVGWDGGVNEQNIKQIAEAGVDVINVGGFIQKSDDPAQAFTTLANQLS